jgi:uncharacterized membrane protein YeaQ/YmgE (transglycosylase-associated protein family)
MPARVLPRCQMPRLGNFAPATPPAFVADGVQAALPYRINSGAGLAELPSMTISLVGLLVLLVIAGICGAVGKALGGGTRGGVIVSIAVGFIGALLGMVIAGALRLPELLMVSVEGRPFPILWSIIGAALFVALLQLLSGGATRRFRYR